MDAFIDDVEAVPESLVHGRNPVELGVMGSHDCAVVAEEFLTRVTEVAESLVVEHARPRHSYMSILESSKGMASFLIGCVVQTTRELTVIAPSRLKTCA